MRIKWIIQKQLLNHTKNYSNHGTNPKSSCCEWSYDRRPIPRYYLLFPKDRSQRKSKFYFFNYVGLAIKSSEWRDAGHFYNSSCQHGNHGVEEDQPLHACRIRRGDTTPFFDSFVFWRNRTSMRRFSCPGVSLESFSEKWKLGMHAHIRTTVLFLSWSKF